MYALNRFVCNISFLIEPVFFKMDCQKYTFLFDEIPTTMHSSILILSVHLLLHRTVCINGLHV